VVTTWISRDRPRVRRRARRRARPRARCSRPGEQAVSIATERAPAALV